jgi:dihydroflavonol-4-reductase
MINKDKPIFITGATGFVGAYLTRYLVKNGYTNITALKRKTSAMDLVADIADKVTWVEGDIMDAPFLENILRGGKIAQIYHCAAVVSFDPRDREDMYRINVEGTANVVNAALEVGIEKMVYVSSVAAIGRTKNEPHIRETNKWQRSPLNTHYAISKYQAEQEVWRGIHEGLCAAMVNPTVILGAQFWKQGTGRLFEQVWTGLRFYTEGSTGYVDVRDVVVFMEKLMQSDIENQRFLLCGENWKYKDMFEAIAQKLDKKPASIPVTPFLRAIAWRVEWVKSRLFGGRPLITRETARVSAATYIAHNEKSLQAFPDFKYNPIQTCIEETGSVFLASKLAGQSAAILEI